MAVFVFGSRLRLDFEVGVFQYRGREVREMLESSARLSVVDVTPVGQADDVISSGEANASDGPGTETV